MSSWELAIEMIGQVPPQWELIYFIGTFIIFLMKCALIFAPIILVLVLVGRRN